MQSPSVAARGLGKLARRRPKEANRDAASVFKRNRIAFGLASVVALAGSYFGVIKPENARLAETRALAEQEEATVAQLRSELAHLRDLEKREGELAQQAVRLNEALPVETHLARFILQVQDASNQAKLAWVSASPTPLVASAVAPGLMESVVSMTASGNYAAVQDFLGRLENLERAVKISSVNIALEGEPSANPNASLLATIGLKIFVAPTAAPLPSEPLPAPAAPAITPPAGGAG